jgi:hypothetical protein
VSRTRSGLTEPDEPVRLRSAVKRAKFTSIITRRIVGKGDEIGTSPRFRQLEEFEDQGGGASETARQVPASPTARVDDSGDGRILLQNLVAEVLAHLGVWGPS